MTLKQAFIRSDFCLNVIQKAALCTKTDAKQMYKPIIKETLKYMTEAQLKAFLYGSLHCYDITPKEKAEIRRILKQSETLFTAEQRIQIKKLF